MKLGTENKKKTIIVSVIGGIAAILFLWQFVGLFSSTPQPPPAAPVIKTGTLSGTPVATAATPAAAGKPIAPIANTAGQLDPTLHMDGMLEAESLEYEGSGRNIFSMQSAPPPVPKPIAPARPSKAVPVAPVAYVPPPPPPPPPIDLKFFGTEASKKGVKQAFLLQGEDVYLASPGDIVAKRYKIVQIQPSGITITDLPNNNTQTLPLIQ